jgi:hypothetical protein
LNIKVVNNVKKLSMTGGVLQDFALGADNPSRSHAISTMSARGLPGE